MLTSFVVVAFLLGLLFKSSFWIALALAGLVVLSPLICLLAVVGVAAVLYYINHR